MTALLAHPLLAFAAFVLLMAPLADYLPNNKGDEQ